MSPSKGWCTSSNLMKELFSILDANGDERIYYSEFLAATMEATERIRDDAVRATFHRLDADNSGTVGVSDLSIVLGDTLSEADLTKFVGKVCRSGTNELAFDDFVRVVKEPETSLTEETLVMAAKVPPTAKAKCLIATAPTPQSSKAVPV
eukprot:TRINITY_DN82329_c0_g1_i1.p1 TRINITY_DN82329_c0_g1~~TRINITY_DN82329_c0_g1_i1.p1  ORF type:complete len:150 (-),score=31.42 TRINITY_DN82329_c0_g1_i1:81-530(-)